MNKKYEVILLDIDDTVFDYKTTENTAMMNVFKDFNYFDKYNLDDYNNFRNEYKIVNSSLWKKLEEGKTTLDELKVERFKQTFKNLGLDYDGEAFGNQYVKRLSESIFFFEGAEDLLKYMYENYKVVVVTNGIKDVQIPRIKNSSVGKYSHGVVISHELGISKPNPLIFEEALKKINYNGDKEKIIMIGDSINADIKGAVNFGIDSCWVNIVNRENNTNINPTYVIENYEQLYKII